jgi:hemerythrin-like domain-containing protein
MLKQSALMSREGVELKINMVVFIDTCHHKKEERLIKRISSAGYKPVFDVKEEYSALRKRLKDVMRRYVSGDRVLGLLVL